jgi:hypothetical protein
MTVMNPGLTAVEEGKRTGEFSDASKSAANSTKGSNCGSRWPDASSQARSAPAATMHNASNHHPGSTTNFKRERTKVPFYSRFEEEVDRRIGMF